LAVSTSGADSLLSWSGAGKGAEEGEQSEQEKRAVLYRLSQSSQSSYEATELYQRRRQSSWRLSARRRASARSVGLVGAACSSGRARSARVELQSLQPLPLHSGLKLVPAFEVFVARGAEGLVAPSRFPGAFHQAWVTTGHLRTASEPLRPAGSSVQSSFAGRWPEGLETALVGSGLPWV